MLDLDPAEEDVMNIAVISELERHHIRYELLPHPPTKTAAAEAHVLHLPLGEVAKTLILGTQHGYVRALVPASRRIDPTKVAAELLLDEAWLVPESVLVGAYPEFELGAIPPVSGPGHDRVIVDQTFRDHPWIVFEAGRHNESVRVRTGDLLAATYAIVADICLD
jgi:Ala-tRNA(Pro) deacylase